MLILTSIGMAQGTGGAIFIKSSGWKPGPSGNSLLSNPVIGFGSVLLTKSPLNSNSYIFALNKDILETNPCDDVIITFNPCDDIQNNVENPMIQSLKMLSLSLFPNPSSTEVRMEIFSVASTIVDIFVYDLKGNLIYNPEKNQLNSTTTQIIWNLTDQKGSKVPSGQYIIKVKSDNFSDQQILTIIK